MSKKPKPPSIKKDRINISLPGWIFEFVDNNRGDTPRSTYISYLLEEIIKQKQLK